MQQIRTQKLKSFFSLLGVILGVMFLIVVVTVVEGIDRYIREDFTPPIFGVNTVTLRRWPSVNINTDPEEWRARMRRPRITFDDADAIRARLTCPPGSRWRARPGETAPATTGAPPPASASPAPRPRSSRSATWRSRGAGRSRHRRPTRACPWWCIGSETAEVIYPGVDPIGRTLRLRGFPYRIIGVLEEQGSLFGQSLDNRVIAPARSPIQSVTNPHGIVDQIVIQTVDPDRLRDAQSEVEGIMRVRHKLRPGAGRRLRPRDGAEEAISFWNKISTILFTALPMLVAISVVVGGIVIMNIMLVSVMERTREIGVRKALGARRRDILTQVLIESATLSDRGRRVRGGGRGSPSRCWSRAVSPMPAAVAVRSGPPWASPWAGGGHRRGRLPRLAGLQARSRRRAPL